MPRLVADAHVLPAPDGDGHEAGPLIFLPALGFTGHSFADVEAVMHARRKRVLIDLPGIGEGTPAESVEGEDIVDAVADTIAGLAVCDCPGVLIGHSIGGGIAARLLARHPERFSALVLVDAAVAPFRFAWWEHLAAHPALWAPLLRWFGAPDIVRVALPRVLHEPPVADGWDLEELSRQLTDPVRRRTMISYYKAFLLPKQLAATAGCLAGVRVPVLLLRGARDFVLPNSLLLDVIAALPEETRVEIHIFAYGGHLLPLEAPAPVARAIDTFVAELPELIEAQATSEPPNASL
jgi:pimeloyl-ACP methyl ester carboxylesterase